MSLYNKRNKYYPLTVHNKIIFGKIHDMIAWIWRNKKPIHNLLSMFIYTNE